MGVRFTGNSVSYCNDYRRGYKILCYFHTFSGRTNMDNNLDISAQVWLASIGFAIFGVGCEVAGITVSKIIVKWFKGNEMALAMGLAACNQRDSEQRLHYLHLYPLAL